ARAFSSTPLKRPSSRLTSAVRPSARSISARIWSSRSRMSRSTPSISWSMAVYSLLVLTSMSWPLYLDRLVSRSWREPSCCLRAFGERGPRLIEPVAFRGEAGLHLHAGPGNVLELLLHSPELDFRLLEGDQLL